MGLADDATGMDTTPPKFVAQAAREGAAVAGALLQAVNFPDFCSALIKGVFHAIVQSSIEQMEAYGKLVADVAKTLNRFRDEQTTDNQGMDYLCSLPDVFQVAVDTGDDGTKQPRVTARDGVDEPAALQRINSNLPMQDGQQLSSLDDDELSAKAAPAARTQLATSRQQLLATMVLMRINRIVVSDGRTSTKVMYDFQSRDNFRYQKSATRFDWDPSLTRTTSSYDTESGSDGSAGASDAVHEDDCKSSRHCHLISLVGSGAIHPPVTTPVLRYPFRACVPRPGMFQNHLRHYERVSILLLFGGLAFGQLDRAVLTGTVFDPTGAAMPTATISVVFDATGFKRSVTTSRSGSYAIAALPLGKCRVTVQANGFQSQLTDAISLEVGETRTLNFHLAMQSTSESVEVTASTVELEQSTAETGGVIGSQQARELAINGRNWAGLMLLIPGAINTGIGNQIRIRFAGHGLDDNKLVFDGTDATGILRQSQKTDLRLQLSSESIAEFRVGSSLYTAEYGAWLEGRRTLSRKPEPIYGMETHSRSPFDPSTVPAFRLNQFGVSQGGPIVKNRTFFFVNYERLQQVQGQTLIRFVPSPSYLASILQSSPQLQTLLGAYSTGQAPTSNPNVWSWKGSGR